MIIAGYIAIFSYVFFNILVVGSIVSKKFNVEVSRKVIHTSLFFIWILINIFLKNTIHQVIIPIIFTVINYLSYKYKIFKNMEREEDNSPGTVYFAIAITIIMLIGYLFPQTYYSTGIAFWSLTFGDGLAAIIGKNTKSKLIYNKKSLNGSITCLVASLIVSLVFNSYFDMRMSFFMCVIIAIASAIFELVGNGLDNFSVTFITFGLSILFSLFDLPNLIVSIFVSELLFLIIFFAKGLDYYGSLLAMFIGISYMYFGGALGISILLGEYFFIFFVAIFKKIIGKSKHKEKPRNFMQVLINGGLGTLFVILYGIFKEETLLIISIISISGCFIDSVSSDVGVLSKKEPYDFIKLKRVERGVSGGISFLGTISSFLVSLIVAIVTYKSLNLEVRYIFYITILIFIQTIIDSIFGSLIQAKYECVKCKKITEDTTHCMERTELVDGFYWVDNNMVNTLASIATTAIAFICLH